MPVCARILIPRANIYPPASLYPPVQRKCSCCMAVQGTIDILYARLYVRITCNARCPFYSVAWQRYPAVSKEPDKSDSVQIASFCSVVFLCRDIILLSSGMSVASRGTVYNYCNNFAGGHCDRKKESSCFSKHGGKV